MAPQNLIDAIHSLTPEQQESVRQFVSFLTQQEQAASSKFASAVDQFIAQHPDLLHRLAQ